MNQQGNQNQGTYCQGCGGWYSYGTSHQCHSQEQRQYQQGEPQQWHQQINQLQQQQGIAGSQQYTTMNELSNKIDALRSELHAQNAEIVKLLKLLCEDRNAHV